MSEETTGTASAAPSSGASSTASAASGSEQSAPASATTTPATGTATTEGASSTVQGPIPYDRHKTILDGVYSERDAAQQALKQIQEQYGWVSQFQGDPLPYVEQWLDELSGHADYGPKVLAKAARLLASRRGQQQPAQEEIAADIPILDAQGRDTGRRAFSSEQLQKYLDAKLQERLTPFETMRQEQEQAKQRTAIEQHSVHVATTTLETLRKDPFFKEHEAAIKAEFAANEAYGDNVAAAALTVLTRDVLPNRDAKTSAKVLDHLQTQANGASVHPSGTATTQSKPKFKDFGDALRYYAEHPDEAAVMAKR